MAQTNHSIPSLLGPLIGWVVVHAIAVAGMLSDTYSTPLVADDMAYRWFFVSIYIVAGLIPALTFLKDRTSLIPVTSAHAMAIAFGLYVFLIGVQIGTLPTDDVRLLTGAWAAVGGGTCLLVFNQRLERARHIHAKMDEDQLIRRIAAAVRAELHP